MRNGFRVRVLASCFLFALALSCIGLLNLFAKTDFPGGDVPAPYFAVSDSGGANNGPGQKDLTQMGWFEDVSPATGPVIDLFWSWDENTVSGGNTLDGCALFDHNNNTLIDTAVCGTVEKKSGQNPGMFIKAVTVYTCVDSRNDRCGGPAVKPYSAADIVGGGLKVNPTVNLPLAGDELLTNTDPFSAGAGYPYDTTLRLRIRRAYLPENSALTNVCSYPSQQPNSDPSDCNNPPGSGYLQITKIAHEDEEPYTDFSFSVKSYPSVSGGENNCPPEAACKVTASQAQTATLSLLVGSASIEETLPDGWSLAKSYCGAEGNSANNPLNATIDSGVIAKCTFDNRRDSGAISLTKVVNDGGTFTLKIMSGETLIAAQENVGNNGTLASITVPTGSYVVSEAGYGVTDLANYTSKFSCSVNGEVNTISGSGISATVNVAKGDVINCTFTNTRISGYLDIIKIVDNAADPEHRTAGAFEYQVNGGPWFTFPESGPATVEVDPNLSYTVREREVAGYKVEYSPECTNIQVPSGGRATCTVTNTALQAKPAGKTTMTWVLHDSIAISGISVADGTASVTFTLYSDAGCTVAVGWEIDSTIVGGAASTSAGIAVSSPGTYKWRAAYSGDAYNEGFTTACGSEVTKIEATYNQ
jgi:hypothetical protein